MLGKDELTSKLESLVEEIGDLNRDESKIDELVGKLLGLMERLVDVDRVDDAEDEGVGKEERANASSLFSGEKTKVGGGAKKGLKLHELKASLQNQIAAKTR